VQELRLEVDRCDELCDVDCGGCGTDSDHDDFVEEAPRGSQRKLDTPKDGGARFYDIRYDVQYESDIDDMVLRRTPFNNKDLQDLKTGREVVHPHFKFQRGDQYEVQFDSDSDSTIPMSDSDDW
jgi:hypothetical protein